MKQNKRRNLKPTSRSHAVKNKTERELYDQKVKLTESRGGTKEETPGVTSTLSEKTVYSGYEAAGIPDRDPIRPPTSGDGQWKWLGRAAAGLGIMAIFVGVCFWFANLKNKVDLNEKQIIQIETGLKTTDSARENLNMRIFKMEQWKDILSEDLRQIKNDLQKGVTTEQIDLKLIELEKKLIKEFYNHKLIGSELSSQGD